MKFLPNILIVLGVCVAALGASGFHTPYAAAGEEVPSREPYALALFVLGCVSMGVGGELSRRSRRRTTDGGTKQEGKASFARDIDAIRDIVVELDEAKATLPSTEIHARIDRLMAEQYFDLTSKSEDLARLIGFRDYARVWDGVAIAERLLNRCWSMITDGYAEQGLAELPLARKSIEQASAAMADV